MSKGKGSKAGGAGAAGVSSGKGSKAGGAGAAGVSSGKGSKAGADSSGVDSAVDSEEASASEDGSFAEQSFDTTAPLETSAPDASFDELSNESRGSRWPVNVALLSVAAQVIHYLL